MYYGSGLCTFGMSYHLHSLAHHRVLEEVNEVLGKRTVVTADDLDQLKYIEQVRCFIDNLSYAES